jgi:hypothetical protein
MGKDRGEGGSRFQCCRQELNDYTSKVEGVWPGVVSPSGT